jgi:RNA polymerase sigma-70 factor (ECF subfamily)
MSGTDGSEIPLVEAARNGDRPAFGRLYQLYAPMVHGIILAHAPRQDAADLVQEVFLRALRELGRLRDAAAFGGWLAAIARNRAHDHYRRSRPADELPDSLAAPGRASDDADAERVLAVVRGLPEAYRETLILRLVEGMTGPEIAARTGLTTGSVRVNLHRGMKLLREQLHD